MRAKFINEESGFYPEGSENDPNAPWNQSENNFTEVSLEDGEVYLIIKERTSEDDWEALDKQFINPEKLERLLASKLNLNFLEMQEENDIIEIDQIVQNGNNCVFETSHGEAEITLDELEELI